MPLRNTIRLETLRSILVAYPLKEAAFRSFPSDIRERSRGRRAKTGPRKRTDARSI